MPMPSATLCLLVPPAISQVPGGVTAAKGFKAAGMYGGLRAKGQKPDLALVTCDVDAIAAGELSSGLHSMTAQSVSCCCMIRLDTVVEV